MATPIRKFQKVIAFTVIKFSHQVFFSIDVPSDVVPTEFIEFLSFDIFA